MDLMVRRVLQCPTCGFTIIIPSEAPLPEEGPVCALSHDPVKMQVVLVPVNQG